MSDCEFILIDTAGRSPTDTLKLNELKNFLAAAEPDEVHLVLSTHRQPGVHRAGDSRFGDVRVDKIIFTKLDEAVHVGVVLNVVRKVNKSLVVRHDRAGRAGRHRSGQGPPAGAVDSGEVRCMRQLSIATCIDAVRPSGGNKLACQPVSRTQRCAVMDQASATSMRHADAARRSDAAPRR